MTAAAYRRLVSTFAPRFSAVSLASPSDARAVGRRHGLHAHVVPNAVAVPVDPPPRTPGSGVVLFVANLDYAPNADAAVELVERVLPALQARSDTAIRIVLVGTYDPGGPINDLASHPAVTLAGFVDDVSGYYARAALVVAPFSTGSGTRIKLIEAFAHEVPVVTTPVGVMGLAVHHRQQVLIGETPEELADAAADLLGSPTLAQTLTTAALQFVRHHHAAPVVAERVREFLRTASSHADFSR